MSRGLRLRRAARALLVDPQQRVLLVRFDFGGRIIWALPGGGLDPGESVEHGLRRELAEELGLMEFTLGPHVWNREHIIPMITGHDGQRDTIHLVDVEAFDPAPMIGWDGLRAENVHEIRWWTQSELAEVSAEYEMEPGETRFAPRRLAVLFEQLVTHGPPSVPIDTGI